MLVRPSLVLQIKLKPQDYSEDAADELKRSYIYLAQSIVSALGEDELADGNVMRLSIRLMRPYWETANPKAQELWEGVMPQWLRNVTRNMSTAMHNYNTVDHPAGVGPVVYDWADYEFGHDALLRVKVDAENRITPEMPAIAEKARALLNDKAFGEDEIALIRIPSAASYEAQLAAALEAQAAQLAESAEEAELGAPEEAADAPVSAPDVLAEAADAPSAPLAAAPAEGQPASVPVEGAEYAELAENAGLAGSIEDAAEDLPAEPAQPVFDIDFSLWGIEYADGRIVEFDSRSA